MEVLNEIECTKSLEVYKTFKRLGNPRTTFHIYLNNYLDLKREINIYYSETFELENGLVRRTSQKSLIRRYHNFLSSARVFTAQFVQEDFNDGFHCFIKELRNYSIHKNFFPLSSRFDMNQNGTSRYESIQINKIEEYLKEQIKNSKSRKKGLINALVFLNSLKPVLNLNDLLEDYFQKMINEYHLIMHREIKENRNELCTLVEVIDKVNHKMKICGLKSPQVLSPSEIRYLRLILEY